MKRITPVLLCLLLTANIAACSPGNSPSEVGGARSTPSSGGKEARTIDSMASLPPGRLPEIKQFQEISRPIESYLLTPDQAYQLEQTNNYKVNECLASLGSSSRIIENPSGKLREIYADYANEWASRSGPWAYFLPIDQISISGYHPLEGETEVVTGPVPLPPQEILDTCISFESFDHPASSFLFTQSLPDGGPPDVAEHTELIQATNAWSACMKDRGYTYKKPSDARDDPRWDGNKPPSSEEISTAISDLECKFSTHLVDIGVVLQKQIDESYISTHIEELKKFQEDHQKDL